MVQEVPEDLVMSPTSFRTGHVVTDAEAELRSLVFVLDAQAALPSVRRLRDWALAELAPSPGETAVDVGSGAGDEVVRLAGLVGPGRAVGVEPHAGLRSIAVDRAAGGGAVFVDGDAYALPFEDRTVDVLRCERVWQHLDRPEAAAREIARVLSPHGRAVVIDSDWGTAISRTGEPDLVRRLEEARRRRTANPFSGRNLRAHLQHAGLHVRPDIGSTALVFPDVMVEKAAVLDATFQVAVEDGTATQEEVDRLRAEVVGAAREGEAFFSVTMYAAVADRATS